MKKWSVIGDRWPVIGNRWSMAGSRLVVTACMVLAFVWCPVTVRGAEQAAASPGSAAPSDSEPPAGGKTAAGAKPAEAPSPKTSPAEAEAAPGTVLPWNRPATDAVRPPTPPLSSAREMLELFSIDASHIRQLEDGRPLVIDEDETLFKILYRIPFFGADKIAAWAKTGVAWPEIAGEPAAHRLEVFPVEGRVTQVQSIELPPETAERLEYGRYFRVRLQLADSPHSALICCRAVPAAWEKAGKLDERGRCLGLFLKTGGEEGGAAELVFAAERVAWLPEQPNSSLGVTPDLVYLAGLGMDAGLFDAVRKSNRRPIAGDDRECFYQLLAAMKRANPADVFGRAQSVPDATPLLTESEAQHGRLLSLLGTALRVQRIAIDEPEIRDRFGIDHYYQVDAFVSLGNTEIRFEQKGGQKEAPVFRNSYPVTCCTPELPAGLPARDDIAVPVRFAGVYFKLWPYKSDYVASFDQRQRQVSPLLIATTPRVVKFDDSASNLVGWIGGIGCVLLVLIAAFYTWFPRRGDKQVEEQLLRPRLELGAAASLNDLGIEARDRPDFSGLADMDRGPSGGSARAGDGNAS